MTDLNDYSSTRVMCIAKNPYGESKQLYIPSLNSLKTSLPSVPVTHTHSDSVPGTPTPDGTPVTPTSVNWKLTILLSLSVASIVL